MTAPSNIRIVVVCGGTSAEADVSRVSGAGVAAALKQNYRDVSTFELSPDLGRDLLTSSPDIVFPILHGPPGEDGTFQGFLDVLEIPYVGSGVHASACGMDKIISKQIFARVDLPLAAQVVVERETDTDESVASILDKLGEYVVVKPARQGSALGVFRIENANELHEALRQAFDLDQQVLVEKRIDGKEITVGVLEKADQVTAFPVIEIITPADSWYDFEHRYTQGLSEHIMPADLPADRAEDLQRMAIAAHRSLECRDLSRADFIVNDDGIVLLEVNTLPGMTPTSLYPDGAKGIGLDFAALVSHLVENALARNTSRNT